MIEELQPDLRRQPAGALTCRRRAGAATRDPARRRRRPARSAWDELLRAGERRARRGAGAPQRRRRSRRHRLHHVHVGNDRVPEGRDAGPQRRPQHLRQRQSPRRDVRQRCSSTTCRSSTPSPSTRRCSCRRPPARATCSWRTFDAGEALRLIEERARDDDQRLRHPLQGSARAPVAADARHVAACAPASAPRACCRASRSRAAPRR